jgi:hypothetical protein
LSGKIKYEFSSKVWKHSSIKSWYFVSLPIKITKEIRETLRWQEEGWGRMKATVQIGNSTWETAIWFDTKHETYLLPLKSEIRKTEKIEVNNQFKIHIWI